VSTNVTPPTAAWYVYGIVPRGETCRGRGVASRPVEVVEADELAALVSIVPLEEFGEDSLPANLNDRAWLERTARAHEQVLEGALSTSAVIPFRLCTIYESSDRVRQLLVERGPALADLLSRLEGKIELGVKAYFDPSRAATSSPGLQVAESGRAYLLRRQRERTASVEADQFKAACAQSSHERLAAVAEEARANPPQAPALSGRDEPMLLNAAYLVQRDDSSLREAVFELQTLYGERGVSYEVTGPWAPYNFVPRELLKA
jgi:hypothetical protein